MVNSLSSSAEEDGRLLNSSDVLKNKGTCHTIHIVLLGFILFLSAIMMDGDWIAGQDELKYPRGLHDYTAFSETS